MSELTKDEQMALVRAADSADGGCYGCAIGVLRDIARIFPQYDWAELYHEVDDYREVDEVRSALAGGGVYS